MGLRHLSRVVLAPVLIVLTCAACTSAAASSGSVTTTTLNNTLILQKGGTVTIAVPHLPSEFNPSAFSGANAVTQEVMQQVWPQLFVQTGNKNVVPNSGLLVSAEVVGLNPQTITYVINPAARWSDGVPITAADFIYDWHEQVAHAAEMPAIEPVTGYLDISKIVSSDNGKSATVSFTQPYANWQALFNNLVPSHIAQRYGWASAFAKFDPDKIVSGGPYELARETPGKTIVLVRNPHYWGTPARLSEIVFRVEPTDAAALDALLSGKVDVAQIQPSWSNQAAIDSDPELRSSTDPSQLLWQIDFNVADPTVSSLALRQAIAASIDRAQLIANTIGLATPYSDVVDNRLFQFAAPGSQGNAGSYDEPDLTEATALMNSAGYHLDTGGKAEDATGHPLVLNLVGIAGDSLVTAMEEQLEAQLLQVGIELDVHNVSERALLNTVLPTGSYQLALAPYVTGLFPSTEAELYTNPVGPTPTADQPTPAGASGIALPASVLSEPAAAETGAVTRDVMGFSDPRVVALFAAASADLDAPAAANLYNEIDTELWATLPTLPLFQVPVTLVTRRDLFAATNSSSWAGPMWNVENWAIQLNPNPYATTTTLGG